MKSAIIKQNLTEKNREKITKFLQKNINQEDNILLVKNEYEDKDQVLNDINNNLVFDYNIYNNSNTDNKLLLDYLNKHFTTNLDQFLKQKGYNVSKNPFVRTEITNKIDNEMFEDNLVKVGFINFLEVDNKKSFLSENIIKEFEVYLMDKLKLMFDIDLQMVNYEDLQQEEEINFNTIEKNIDNELDINIQPTEIKFLSLNELLNKEELENINLNDLYRKHFKEYYSKKDFINSIIYLQALKNNQIEDIIDLIKEDNYSFEDLNLQEYSILIKKHFKEYIKLENDIYNKLNQEASASMDIS